MSGQGLHQPVNGKAKNRIQVS